MSKKKYIQISLLFLLVMQPKPVFPAVNLAVTLGISYVMGVASSWFFGAYPRDFEERAFNPSEQTILTDLKTELKEFPNDASLNAQIGIMYTKHNFIDEAEPYLENAKSTDTKSGLYLAWYGSNYLKQAGASWDFTWGFYKLYRVDVGIDTVNKAVRLEPENWEVRLVRLRTFAGLDFDDSIKSAQKDVDWYLKLEPKNPEFLLPAIKQQFYLGLSEFYLRLADRKDETANKALAKQYWQQAKAVNSVDAEVQKNLNELQADF